MAKAHPVGRAPTAVPIIGGLAILVAAASACAAGYRIMEPEAGLPAAAADRLMSDGVIAAVVTIGLVLFLLTAVLLFAASIGLLLGRPWGRRLAVVWCWVTLGVQALAVISNSWAVGSRAGAAEVPRADALLAAFTVPSTGCCISVFALVALLVLSHDTVRAWSRGIQDPKA